MVKRFLGILLGLLMSVVILEGVLGVASWLAPRWLERRDEPSTAPQGVFRILCVGDSNTYGAGVDRSESYPARLQQLLDAAEDGPRFDVVNLGVPGTNSAQLLHRLPQYIRFYDPDLLILLIGVNDYWNPAETSQRADQALWTRLHRRLSALRSYRLILLIAEGFRSPRPAVPEERPTVAIRQLGRALGGDADATINELRHGELRWAFKNPTREVPLDEARHQALVRHNLERAVALADSARVPVLLSTYATDIGHYGVANRGIQEVPGAPVLSQNFVVDLFERVPELRTRDGRELFFRDLHPKAPIYSAYALNLCEGLVGRGLLPLERCEPHPALPRADR